MLRLLLLIALLTFSLPLHAAEAPRKPNIIFILADDLGYGELGCYGQTKIKTPNLDRLAAQGLRFTQFYAGSTVCAPSRSVLMTGQHTGHTTVRGNKTVPLRPEDKTLAELLKDNGYATGLIGKWGLGEPDTAGAPNRQGFNYFFGYTNQTHAHNYYPEWLLKNGERFPLRNEQKKEGRPYERSGAGYAAKKVDYSHDLFAADALRYVEENKDRPFFLYLALTIPHANNEATRATKHGQEVPDLGIYKDQPWTDQNKAQAAMITRMDSDIGRLMTRLKDLGIDRNTLVFFSSDNGPHKEGGNDPDFFRASGPHRGIKRALTDGGIRVPFIAHWPGAITHGVSHHVAYFGDLYATLCDLLNQPTPPGLDSLSFAPTLLGRPADQKQHDFLYWEFHEGGFKQAVRHGPYKALRLKKDVKLELYDVTIDPAEQHNLAADKPDIVAKIEAYLKTARTDSADFPIK
jgi:arylsulfatase A-like enzyme